MYVVEIFLPLTDKSGEPFPAELFAAEKTRLSNAFGGLTAYSRAPAQGEWNGEHDDIVILEVMTETLDVEWWANYRRKLEAAFHQDEVLIRATAARRL